jgi:hypothetical protein
MVRLLENLPVFEILSDIAFTLLVLRFAFFYYGLTFLAGCILGFIRHGILLLIYQFPESTAELVEMPYMLLEVAFLARFMVTRFDIPKIAWVRLAVRLLGLLMLVAEFVRRVMVYRDVGREMLQEDAAATESFTALLVVFGLMPRLLMLLDGEIPTTQRSRPMQSVGCLFQLPEFSEH